MNKNDQFPAYLDERSEQSEQAPDSTGHGHARQVFQNFIKATYALLDCDETPAALHESIANAVNVAGNELHAFGEPSDAVGARKTLARIFNLDAEDAEEDDDKLPPLDIEEALREIRRFLYDPNSARLGSNVWPQTLTLQQMFYQCGYLIRGIIEHPETADNVREAFINLLATLRKDMEKKDAFHLSTIDAGVMFAPMAMYLSQFRNAV